jgi:tartrate dehydratase alpha subunit/fumarate hydratase class I-like protein
MFLPRCNPLGLPGPLSMAGTAMGGMAMLACVGPFLAGVGVGAGIVGAAVLARKAMERRSGSGWRDDPMDTMATDLPDEGESTPVANPL